VLKSWLVTSALHSYIKGNHDRSAGNHVATYVAVDIARTARESNVTAASADRPLDAANPHPNISARPAPSLCNRDGNPKSNGLTIRTGDQRTWLIIDEYTTGLVLTDDRLSLHEILRRASQI
jgi:hypothetical protein